MLLTLFYRLCMRIEGQRSSVAAFPLLMGKCMTRLHYLYADMSRRTRGCRDTTSSRARYCFSMFGRRAGTVGELNICAAVPMRSQ